MRVLRGEFLGEGRLFLGKRLSCFGLRIGFGFRDQGAGILLGLTDVGQVFLQLGDLFCKELVGLPLGLPGQTLLELLLLAR
ncbi:hypothetical protein [Aromatoleum petrolei]|uniref:Uncharacterized protein n=1 Tax=Aromatoleum petrolei TaxID=76116 RepID=A0ABX1MWL8_9RHOO|nr:hypothetical protein [Aromatoleum petrolei]